MRAVEHAPVWEWRAWWWIPDERDVPQIPPEIDERRTEHVCLDSDRVGAVLHRAVLRAAGVSGDLRNAEGDRASDVALQMKVRLQAEHLEQLRDQVRRLGAAPVA